jgi:MazG family protein
MNRLRDPLSRLSELVATLRGPGGCPWDREQTLEDLRAYLLEEAHEVASAIDGTNWDELCGELGDLLFQWVFIAKLAEEQSRFGITEVIDRIEAKMISRHPHVFGNDRLPDSAAVRRAWEGRKLRQGRPGSGLLAGVPTSLPALVATHRMTQKASAVGFDWSAPPAVLETVEEELEELRQELGRSATEGARDRIREELGDLLFTLANLARHLEVDPEAALAGANSKFRQRFARMETILAGAGIPLSEASLEQLDAAWEQAKVYDSVNKPSR